MTETKIFGIRHHGPGSARALRNALEAFGPDAILIEGPPEADAIIGLAADPGMVPPVALLAHVPGGGRTGATARADEPDQPGRPGGPDEAGAAGEPERRAAFWPFAEFSPEWQAIRYGVTAKVPVRFCDLPAAHQLADEEPARDLPSGPGPDPGPRPAPDSAGPEGADPDGADRAGSGPAETGPAAAEAAAVRLDPLGRLAEAAGYDDAERWWDDVMEHRYHGSMPGSSDGSAAGSPFDAIAEAMSVLREHTPPMPADYTLREERREAYMRRTLRRTLREGYERVAVVCGAWHVPAIAAALKPARSGSGSGGGVTAAQDDRTLRGLPKARIDITWVPWTHGRLAGHSGYGAGVRSPGWYNHLFTAPDRPIERWLTEAARLLRDEDLPVSSAHVIEAVRLAESLAALRDRPLAGLDEVTEATRAVLCEGAELPLALIQRRMVVGERLGGVPESTPMVPLRRDLQAEQRRLRLRPSALETEHDLDLRKSTDLDRSRLLHRLRLLGIEWGAVGGTSGRSSRGTFRETWTLAWRPEFDVETIEASVWGTTVREATTAKARALAGQAADLPALTALVEQCLLADLPGALPDVMRRLADLAAADTDVAHLMAALPALVRALRYGDVRGTSTGSLQTVVDGLVIRICVGLPPAVSGLDDDAARDLLERVDQVQGALALLDTGEVRSDAARPGADRTGADRTSADRTGGGPTGTAKPGPGQLARWHDTLTAVVDRAGTAGAGGLHGLLEGRLTRLLFDAGRLGGEPHGGLSDRMARAVSAGEPPARAAAWIEGFLAGGGLVLVHDETLLRLVDSWISGLPADAFTDVLPLLRRTFAEYESPERRSIGERVRRLDGTGGTPPGPGGPGAPDDEGLDTDRAAPAVRTVLGILGWETTTS